MTRKLSLEEKKFLLKTARQAILEHFRKDISPQLAAGELPQGLLEPGACFVTLTKAGQLRGCVGSIEATQSLIQDVRDRSVAAAFGDPRFPALELPEMDQVQIEISTLTPPESLVYDAPGDLPPKLRVGIDGVILRDGFRRATFLPQVWDKLPDPELFLSRLCQKMGLAAESWRERKMEVQIYQVDKFSEGDD